jgi:hypothetical protein
MSWKILEEWIRICAPQLENYVNDDKKDFSKVYFKDVPKTTAKENQSLKNKTKKKTKKKHKQLIKGPIEKYLSEQVINQLYEDIYCNYKYNPSRPKIKIYEFLNLLLNTHPKSEIVIFFLNFC